METEENDQSRRERERRKGEQVKKSARDERTCYSAKNKACIKISLLPSYPNYYPSLLFLPSFPSKTS
jgi:hypothetical protein